MSYVGTVFMYGHMSTIVQGGALSLYILFFPDRFCNFTFENYCQSYSLLNIWIKCMD